MIAGVLLTLAVEAALAYVGMTVWAYVENRGAKLRLLWSVLWPAVAAYWAVRFHLEAKRRNNQG